MAVLGKIRERSLLLIGIIGFALFAFIAEEMVRSCESSRAEQSQRAGEVNGKKLEDLPYEEIVSLEAKVIAEIKKKQVKK